MAQLVRHPRPSLAPAIAVLCAWFACQFATDCSAADEPRFAARFADGAYVPEGKLTDWHNPEAQPKLNGRVLFDPAKPIRFLRNADVSADARPKAFVEFVGGDCLVGRVTGFISGQESLYEAKEPQLLVAPAVEISGPGNPQAQQVAVVARWARRIVLDRRTAQRYMPGNLFYRDGRQTPFRRIRFRGQSVLLLAAAGPVEVPLDDIAEIHLPAVDPWSAYFEQLAALGVGATDRLVRVETSDGMRLTTSTARFRPQPWGNAQDAASWYRSLQPAWCARPITVAQRKTHTMMWTSASDVPLSWIEPAAFVQTPVVGGSWPPRFDRNVRDALLRAGGRECPFGVGTTAMSRIAFALPEGAAKFRSDVAIDKSVGSGGCAKALVYGLASAPARPDGASGNDSAEVPAPTGKPLWSSDFILGGKDRVSTGDLSLSRLKQLVLVTDAAHEGRPADADPFDIRDLLDWCEPVIELDRAALDAAIAARVAGLVPAWEGWTAKRDGEALKLVSEWQDAPQGKGSFVSQLPGGAKPITLTATLTIEPNQRFLMLVVDQTIANPPADKIAIRIDGEPYGEFTLAARRPGSDVPLPRLLDVTEFRSRRIKVELIHPATDEKSRIRWRQIALVDRVSASNWTVLTPASAKSAEGAMLAPLGDGSLLVTGRTADRDLYTIEAETKLRGITALRLEALLDETLPQGGPGRGYQGNFQLSELRVAARATKSPATAAKAAALANPQADFREGENTVERAIDGRPQTGWSTQSAGGDPHTATFEFQVDPTIVASTPAGESTTLTLFLDQQFGQRATLGRFRISVTADPTPIAIERPGKRIARSAAVKPGETPGKPASDQGAPKANDGRLVVFEDDQSFVASFKAPRDRVAFDTGDKFTGGASLRVKGAAAENPQIPKLSAAIREHPTTGQFRYLRFAWKKRGGGSAVVQLASGGEWSAKPSGAAAPREMIYLGGAGDSPPGAINVQATMPDDWTVVTRDLYADFGAIDLTGFRFAAPTGELLIDHVQLARTLDEFERQIAP
jgi:hypothetical protein